MYVTNWIERWARRHGIISPYVGICVFNSNVKKNRTEENNVSLLLPVTVDVVI